MEHMFQRNFFAFFLEFKMFGYYFTKAVSHFMKLLFELVCLLVVLLKCLGHLFFVGPSLIQRLSPNQSKPVEKNRHAFFPRNF
jgi:hypothetical protein